MNKSAMTTIIALALSIIGYFNRGSNEILMMTGLFALSGGVTNWIAIHMLFEKIPLMALALFQTDLKNLSRVLKSW